MATFPWIMDFFPEIDSFDDGKPHKLSEYQAAFGDGYIQNIPARYWIHLGGRALKTFEALSEMRDCRSILSANDQGCGELTDVSHFHLDLFGNYVPGLCAGLAIQRKDLGRALNAGRYPILSMLYEDGINAVFDYACRKYGFEPEARYLSKCHLCSDIRRFLVMEKQMQSLELQPKGYYEQL